MQSEQITQPEQISNTRIPTVASLLVLPLRSLVSQLIACQVKSLSFLTYLLRGFSPLMKPHQDKISNSVIMLMKTCPKEAVTTRKELLVATRHILATDFRDGFFKHADLLFDETMLVGTGRLARDTLRPLGESNIRRKHSTRLDFY